METETQIKAIKAIFLSIMIEMFIKRQTRLHSILNTITSTINEFN